MRSTLLRVMLLLTAGMLSPCALRADDSSDMAEAIAVARTWLSEIDAGQYDKSYLDAGDALHQKVPQDTWTKILQTERPQMGKVVSREEISHTLHDGLEGASGTFIVIEFHTSFERRPDEREVVVVKQEFSGWRGVGYNFGPTQVQADPDAAPPTTTVIDTNLAPPAPTTGVTVPATR